MDRPATRPAVGVAFENLPHIDYVLISHDHWDHLDLPTLEMLVERDNPTILAGLGVKSVIPDDIASRVSELAWWQTSALTDEGPAITFVPARHQSG